MAMKSDFAQKLLSDLRMKKERMAESQRSSNSNMMARDGQTYSRQTYKGTQRTTGQEPVRSNTTNSQRRATGSARLLTDKENSSQLVQYRSGQSSGQLGDIPMGFLLAIQNSGKHGKRNFSGSNPMLQFLQQIGRRSLDDTGNMAGSSSFNKHSSSHFPTFSNLHVNEISKGVQNLNQILRTCSNGLNFDKYAIEVGKELLKGATDLEESLRMLVDLQEASEYMIKPQRKSRITLLEEEEDDEGNDVPMVQQKQLDLPRFSFDKRSRNSHGIVAKTDPNQRLIELTYHAKTSSLSNNKTATDSNSEPHRHSASWSPNFKTLSTNSEPRSRSNSSQSVTEKGRMSSVIAKLMGLEELPERVDPQSRQKESGLRNGEGTGLKITYMTTKNSEIKTQRQANAEMKTQKTERQALLGNKYNMLKQDNKLSETKNIKGSEKPEKSQVSPQLNSVSVNADEKSQTKNNERAKRFVEGSGTEKAAIRKDKQQGSINQSNKIPVDQKNILAREAGEDSTKHKHRKITDKDERKEPVIRDEMQQKVQHKHKSLEAANILQEKTEWMEVTAQIEKINSEMHTPKNQQKSQQDNGLHQLHMLRKSEIQEEKNPEMKREEKNIKSNMLVTTHSGSPLRSKVPPKTMQDGTRSKKKHPHTSQAATTGKSSIEIYEKVPQKEQPDCRHEEKNVGDENAIHVLKNTDENASTKELVSQIETEKQIIPPLNQKKPAHILATGKKVEITQKLRGQIPRKMNERVKKRNGTLSKLETPSKHHNTVIQASRQKMHDEASWEKGSNKQSSVTSEKGEGSTKETSISEAITPSLNAEEQKHLVATMTMASNSSEDNECRSPKAAYPLNANDSSKDLTSEASLLSDDYTAEASLGNENSGQKSNTTLSNSQNSSIEKCHPRWQEQAKAPISWKHEILSENEKKLKEVLVKSPLFLNTAEALFKLNIPVGILHASDQNYQEKATKSTIDCAYEVMNRKGRRQELAHPCFKISIRCTTVSSLDDLVKQLFKDFERLKYYGGNEHDDYDAAESLLKMLARDIQNTDPHLNCMWDFGWNEFLYAFDETEDTIKDVERQVLDELIDQITSEL